MHYDIPNIIAVEELLNQLIELQKENNQLLKKQNELKQQELILQKNLLTYEEAELYTSKRYSTLTKLVENNLVEVCKPNGKIVYIVRSSLDRWMRGEAKVNPVVKPIKHRNKR